MLGLMELTLLGSKNKVWTNEAIEKLLKHLDEEIPLWNDNIDWKNIFSDNLLISISYKLNELGFDYLYKISKDLDINKSERIVDSLNKNTHNPNTGFGDRSFFSEHGGFRFQFKMSEMTAFHQHRITMRYQRSPSFITFQ
jgi:hypothetical protein